MLLNTRAFDPSSEVTELMVERDKPVRDKWVDFYEHGGRICSVTNGGGAAPCFIHAPPTVAGRILRLPVQPILVTEVWCGLTNRLSSLFVRINGTLYYGAAMNGWKV